MKKKKQVKAYSLGGLILLIVIVVVIAACISMGVITINKDFSCSGNGDSASALRRADNGKQYSNVIADLSKDESFNADDFPTADSDYSLTLVQIAESKDKELFVYVYSPSKREAREIRFSTAINDNAKYIDYTLTLCNASGTLSKYVVNAFTVLPDALRYYDIVQLTRAFEEDIDPAPTGDNTVSNMPYAVGQQWRASTVEGRVSYTQTKSEVEIVTAKFVGSIRYFEGRVLFNKTSIDSHYVAFSSVHVMDNLYEADVSWVSYPLKTTEFTDITTGKEHSYGERNGEDTFSELTLKCDDEVFVRGGRHSWKRIQSVAEFIATESDLSEKEKKELVGKQWVLRFTETPFVVKPDLLTGKSVIESTSVVDVTILRLMFDVNGTPYNLGVVDGKQTGANDPDFSPDIPLIVRIWDAIVAVAKAIWNGTVAAFNGVVWFFKSAFSFIAKYWKWFVIGLGAIVVLCVVVKIIVSAAKR